MVIISNNKNKNIYKGSWWYNNKRKHPSIVIKSNNKDYFEIRLLSHDKYNGNDFVLKVSPNPNGDKEQQYINAKKYAEKKTILIFVKKESERIATCEISSTKNIRQFYMNEEDHNNCKATPELEKIMYRFLDTLPNTVRI